jgi:hypothetical protein
MWTFPLDQVPSNPILIHHQVGSKTRCKVIYMILTSWLQQKFGPTEWVEKNNMCKQEKKLMDENRFFLYKWVHEIYAINTRYWLMWAALAGSVHRWRRWPDLWGSSLPGWATYKCYPITEEECILMLSFRKKVWDWPMSCEHCLPSDSKVKQWLVLPWR